MILNRSARLILNVPYMERITPSLIELHWLPIKARIIYKICVLVFQALTVGQPSYIYDILTPFHTSSLTLRHSDDQYRLLEPRVSSHTGTRSFYFCAPRLFNCLPQSIKESETLTVFKKILKTHLFAQSFNLTTMSINDNFQT